VTEHRQPRFGHAASTLAVTTVLAAVLLNAQGALEWPPTTTAWHQWLSERGAAETFVAIVRLGALAMCWYVLVATGVGVVARMVSAGPLVRAADAVSLPAVRAIVRWAMGASLTASTALTTSPAVAARPAPPAITMTRLPDAAAPTPSPPVAPPTVPAPPPPVTTWAVRPGQSLWTIARDVESLRQGREASEREVSAYWRALIDANRDLLTDRRNPHLVFAGQLFRLPPPRDR
jgi:hypothetical protein